MFKTIFDKGLVYKSFRVMPYSTACNTPLSNFEAGLNYKDDTIVRHGGVAVKRERSDTAYVKVSPQAAAATHRRHRH